MTKDRLLKKLSDGGISPDAYSLGYEIKNGAVNIHTLPNAKYYVFILDERGEKHVIKTNINFEEEAFDVLYDCFKAEIERKHR